MSNALSSFVENPVKNFSNAASLRKDIEEKLEKKAIDIESGLENSFVTEDSISPYRIVYFTKRLDENGPGPLIAESLLYERAMTGQNTNIHRKLHEAIEMYRRDDNFKAVGSLRSVLDYLPADEDEGYNNLVDDGAGGWHYPGSQTIVMKKAPQDFFSDITVPPVMKPLVKRTYRSEVNVNKILVHEFSHAWLALNTGNYSDKDTAGAINEIMAYYTSYVVNGYQFSNEESDLYDRPDLIRWGLQLLVDKAEEFKDRGSKKTGIDFGRSLMLKIYENAVNGIGSDFKILLKACLLEEDKRRLQRFRKLDEEVNSTLSSIKHMMFGDVQGTLADTSEGQKIKELGEEITWENPGRMEKVILQNILRKAIQEKEYGDLEWVNYQITSELEERLEMLDKYRQAFNVAREGLNESEFKEDVIDSEQHIMKLEQKLKAIKDDGEISEATLKNTPAIIVDE